MFYGSGGKFIIKDVLPVISFGKLYITMPGAITIIVGLVLALLTLIVVLKTPWGRTLRGVAENPAISSSLMSNPSKIRFYTFILATILAGFIGIMTGLNSSITPQLGFHLTIMAFVALLIGGQNNLKGTIIASYIVTLIPELIIGLSKTQWHITASWKMFFVFILATILLIWKPQGLLTKKQRLD